MESWKGKVAIVTGASAGIGAAAAVALADAGMQVVAVARRLEPIEVLAKEVRGSGKIHARRCDVSKQQEVEELFQHVRSKFGGVQLMVNNAAFLANGYITSCLPGKQVSMLDVEQQLSVNVRAAVHCTRLAVDSMRERAARGHVIFINSIAGHYLPQNGEAMLYNVYPGTKHAITAVAEVVRRECSFTDTHIRVTSISPGAVDTDMLETLIGASSGVPKLKPRDIADAILYAIAAPPHVNVQEITIHPTGERF